MSPLRSFLGPKDILAYIYEYGYTSEPIAQAVDTDMNLVTLMIAALAQAGYGLRPSDYRSIFLVNH